MRNAVDLRVTVLFPYAFAILCTVIATWVRHSLTPYLDDRVPFGCFFLSVMVSAWVGGVGPAIVSLILGLLLATHFIIPPDRSLWVAHPSDMFSMLVYFVVGVASIFLFFLLERRTRDAERQSDENVRLSEELRIRDRRKDEFLAVLAHELRNPLAPIKSGVSLICRMCGGNSRTEEVSRMLNRQIDQISSIVNDLMDVSGYIRDQIALSFELVNINEIAESACDAVASEMFAKQHRFTSTISGEDLFVQGDRVRLMQIVTNLLLNAAKYTPVGGRIQLFVDSDDDVVRFEIRDNGIGIDRECHGYIFEMFSQVDAVWTREHGGLGLGLAIVRSLTEKHGGSVTVQSEGRGRGARFIVSLPRVNDAETERHHEPTDVPIDGERALNTERLATRHSPLIYVVDDNTDAAYTLAQLLQLEGFRSQCFADGPAALQAISETPPHAVVLDIGLPGMDGYEVARRIRGMPGATGIQLLACTGWGSDEDIQKSRDAGIDEHLVKPIDVQQIIESLRCKPILSGS